MRVTNLPETHLISENAVDTLFVEGGQPVQTLELIFFQRGHQHLWLCNGQRTAERSGVLEIEFVGVH